MNYGEWVPLAISLVAFVAGAAAIVRYSTLQTAIASLNSVVAAYKLELSQKDATIAALEVKADAQAQQITVLENTVNSSDLIRALDAHLAMHHEEAIRLLTEARTEIVGLLRDDAA